MFDKLWKLALSLLVLTIVGGVLVWWLSQETPREMSPLMEDLARETSTDFAKAVPEARDVDTVLLVISGKAPRDEEQQFRDMLTRDLALASKYDLKTWDDIKASWEELRDVLEEEEGWAEQALDQLTGGQTKKEFPETPPESLELTALLLQRLRLMGASHQDRSLWEKLFGPQKTEKTGGDGEDEEAQSAPQLDPAEDYLVDGILYVWVEEFDTGDEGLGAKISVEATIWDNHQQKVVEAVDPVVRSIDSSWDRRYLHHRIGDANIVVRFLLFFVLACGLPWALLKVIRAVLKRRENAWTMSLLAGLTLVDLFLAWVILFAVGLGWGYLVGLLIFGGLMGYYNYDAVDYIDRKLR